MSELRVLLAMKAFCVECKEAQKMIEIEEVQLINENGIEVRALRGKCPKCRAIMFRIISSPEDNLAES